LSVYKRRGRWSVAVELPEGLEAKRRRRYVGSFATKAEAQRAEREAHLERDYGVAVEPEKLTVAALQERYIAHKEARWAYGTLVRCRELAKATQPFIGNIPVRNLSPLAIEEMYMRLAAKWAPQTVLHVHRFAKGAFKWGVTKNLVVRSPFDSVETPSVPRRESRALSPSEARSLLAAVQGGRYYAPFMFALLTGARRGEVAALSWDDVDLERAVVTIRRSFTDRTGNMEVKTTKSGRARTFALSPRAVELLRQQRVTLNKEKLVAAPGVYRDENLVFPDAAGAPTKLHALTDTFKRAARNAGVDNASFHSLRHTSATWMLGQGSDVRSVQAVLGHSVPSTTLNIYGHAVEELQVRAVATLDATLATGFVRQKGA
jgi:integrase